MAHPTKFRVWDKEEKVFVPEGQVAIDSKGTIYSYDKIEGRFVKEILKLEISWFTGLYDKNGKEIYQGDIVECNNIVCEVIWNQTDAAFELKTATGGLMGIAGISKHLTIIGNIYENPNVG